MKTKIFGTLQKIGKSLMLPIAILPIAGLFLGIGSSLTSLDTIFGIQLGHLDVLLVLKSCGATLFNILPLIFAISVAIGLAKARKEVAALSGLIAFFSMHATISGMITISGIETNTYVMGLPSLEMGVFGGIIVGIGVGLLHNRFYQIQLPTVLSFFEGERFVPIVSTVVYFLVGIFMFYTWPAIETMIIKMGQMIGQSGYIGTFIYGFTKRILVPFGLHHIWYTPFYQSPLGGTMMVNGTLVSGAQNIFFAQLNDSSVLHYSVEASRFFTGDYLPIMFGLPGAALALYQVAKPEAKKKISALLLSATFTSILTGITEPLDFTFLFAAPMLYVINALLAGVAFVLCQFFSIAVGFTFSSGLIDFILFGVMQGSSKTHWPLLVGLGVIYFIVYYLIFRMLILKFNYKTIGREDDEKLTIFKKKPLDYSFDERLIDPMIQLLVQGVGGRHNFEDLDCCVTRIRMTIHDTSSIQEALLKKSGAAGIMLHGNGLQIIYGPQASNIKTKLEAYIETVPEHYDQKPQEISYTKEKINYLDICEGESYPLSDVSDPIYANQMMGDGIAIKPTTGKIYSPCDGEVTMIYPTMHAIGIKDQNGYEILLHFGINSVKMNGAGFNIQVQLGQKVAVGDLLWDADLNHLKTFLDDETIVFIITNLKDHEQLIKQYGKVRTNQDILTIEGR